MPRIATTLLAALVLALPASTRAQQPPPHGWLFGTWTGGIFPPPSNVSASACLAQPVVIFSRDLVLRATITDQLLTQRIVETARTTASGAEFRLAASSVPVGEGTGLLGLQSSAPVAGFGCESPDVLHVQKRGENEISFPGCADFPYPLVRCPSR